MDRFTVIVTIERHHLQSELFSQIQQQPAIRPLSEMNLSYKQHGNNNKPHADGVPHPAPSEQRIEPLPWQQPKASQEDPEAASRIKVLLDSPSYMRADQDVRFLGMAESRGARLALDYQKPELYLQRHNVENTIVVFGSTRICEPAEARRRIDELEGLGE